MSRKAITIKYQGTGSVLLYGPEIPYATQKAGVKAAVAVISAASGSGQTAFYEIWVDNLLTKKYHAKYKGGRTPGAGWEITNPTIKGGLE